MTKNMTIKKQLYLMVILPILGFLYFAGNSACEMYRQISELKHLEQLTILSQKANELTHSLQNERGYSMCFVKTKREKFESERNEQLTITDRKLKEYLMLLGSIDVSQQDELFKDKIHYSTKELEKLGDFRKSVYDLKVEPFDIAQYYSTITKNLLSITEQISLISTNSQISKLASVDIALLKAKDEASMERTIINSVLLTKFFDARSYNNFSYSYTSQEAYLAHFKSFATPLQKDFYDTKMAHGSILETNRVRKLAFLEIEKTKIVSNIKSYLGYGGLVHSYKNFLLKGNAEDYNNFATNYQKLQETINSYKALNITDYEKEKLANISTIVETYKSNIEKIKDMKAKNINVIDIDKSLNIDDSTAIGSLDELSKRSIGITSAEWCLVATDRINVLNEIENKVSKDLLDKIVSIKQQDYKHLIIFLTIIVGLALATIFVLYKITKRLNTSLKSLESGLNDFFDYLSYKDQRPTEIKIYGDDEIANMSKTINENIALVEAGLRCDKNVMKEVSEAVEAIQKDIFTADEVLCFADNPMLEDLKDDFNQMLKVVRDRTRELAEYKENLEQIIIMKTNELEKLNRNLETKVVEKTAALKDAMEVLEGEKERLANFSTFLSTLNSVDVGYLCNKALKHLMSVSNSLLGLFYLKENEALKLLSSYSIDNDSLSANVFNLDTLGIITNTLDKKEWIEINQIDENALVPINLGITQLKFTNFYAIPLIFQNKKLGVIVLAGAKTIDKNYLDSYIKALTSSLNNAVSYNLIQKQSLILEQANLELKRADKLKSEFLANMSHELRTPLNSIIGFSSILQKNKKENLDDKQLVQLEKINTNGNHLLSLINDILDLSKIEAGKIEVDLRDIDILSLVDTTVGMLQGQAHNKSIKLQSINETGFEKLKISTDDNKLRQVVVNLIGNAIKFVEAGSGSVEVITKLNHNFVEINIKDNGIGIPEDKLDIIFEAFRQADGSTTRKYGGTGLGLTISKNIIELLGGKIGVVSKVGDGSTFTIYLPLNEVKKVDDYQKDIAVLLPKDKKSIKSVLIIDDTKDSREIIEEYLKDFIDLEIYTAQDGESGLKLAKELKPSLIISDIMMPGMNGWQVLEHLQKEEEFRNIPVIIISNVSNETKALSLGAIDCLNKPISKNDLMTVFKKNFKSQQNSVLVVDDEPDIRDLMVDILQEDVKTIKLAKNGAEAYNILENGFYPDLVFLDLMMPDIDGFKFLEMVKVNPKYQSLPIIVISAKDLTKSDLDILERRNVQIIRKGKDLENAVKKALK